MKVTITTQDATGLIEEQFFTNLTPTYVMEVLSHPYLVKAVIEKEEDIMKDINESVNKLFSEMKIDPNAYDIEFMLLFTELVKQLETIKKHLKTNDTKKTTT